MDSPSIITEPNPPKAWTETIQRALHDYNTAATGMAEFYPVVFLVKDAGNTSWAARSEILRAGGCTYDRCGSIRCGADADMPPD